MKKNVITASLLICTAFQIFLSEIDAAEVCEWNFRSCPEDINGQLITVPNKVISLAPNIRACETMTELISADTPAVMFVIDNSSSMSASGGGTGNDGQGARFTVTSALLDTISKAQPGARVGLVVFRAGLYFDSRTHNILTTLEGNNDTTEYKNQAYLAPLKLDSTYSFGDANMTGLEILKYFLKTTDSPRNVQLTYQPQFDMQTGTNINYGFEAALQGFKKIPEELISKEQRFIVFLSDGTPTEGVDEGEKPLYYFKQGINTPTTFTVFLHNTARVPPDSLVEMTENIRKNGYSETNPRSDIWITKSVSHDSLMSLFMNNVMNVIINKSAGKPTVMKLNGKISTTYADSAFKFSDQFNIIKDTTEFSLEVTWHITDEKNGRVYDSSATTGFKIVRSSKVDRPSEGYLSCWERDLILQYDGKPVTAVNETMNTLEAVFTTSSDRYKSVMVEVTHKKGDALDQIKLPLVESDSKWSEKFQRLIGTANPKDKILQHASVDSIILIYRNPDNPLDTIRKAYPFSIDKILTFPAAYYYDSNADGYVDSIYIKVEGAVVQEDLDKLKSSIHLPSYRNFKVNSLNIVQGGIAFNVTEQSKDIKTYVTTSDVIIVDGGNLPGGGIITGNIINAQDKMAPVLISGKLFSTETNDSLQVVFSEPVDHFSLTEPIMFSYNGTVYTVKLAENGVFSRETYYTSKVISVQTGFAISNGDLIWINPAGKIGDTLDNKQENPENRRVKISVQEIPYKIVIKTVNNPLKSDVPIPDIVRKAYEENGRKVPSKGLVFVVEPKGDIKRAIKIESYITIYDVVKNLIRKNMEGFFDKNTQKLYCVWDGLNEKGRIVGTGTYSAIVRSTIIINDNNRSTSESFVPCGVRLKE